MRVYVTSCGTSRDATSRVPRRRWRKVGRYVHGLLADTVDELAKVAKRYSAVKAVIAFPSASIRRVREVARTARGGFSGRYSARAYRSSGRAQMSQLRPIEQDLLGRDSVDLDSGDIRSMLAGKRILVTGAVGVSRNWSGKF